MARFLGLVTGATLLLWSTYGLAQVPTLAPAVTAPAATAPPATAPAATAPAATAPTTPAAAMTPVCPPDIAVLKDGSRFRGTIAELVPGNPVTIVLISGETRTFEADKLAYAGPTSREPAPSAPAAAIGTDDETADDEPETPSKPRVRFLAADQRTKFFYHAAKGYRELCAAPCARELDPGRYEFGARRNPDDELTLENVRVKKDVVVTAEVNSHRGLRSVGKLLVTLGGLSAVGGAGYLLLSRQPDDVAGYALVLNGVTAISLGFSFAFKQDGLRLTVEEP